MVLDFGQSSAVALVVDAVKLVETDHFEAVVSLVGEVVVVSIVLLADIFYSMDCVCVCKMRFC